MSTSSAWVHPSCIAGSASLLDRQMVEVARREGGQCAVEVVGISRSFGGGRGNWPEVVQLASRSAWLAPSRVAIAGAFLCSSGWMKRLSCSPFLASSSATVSTAPARRAVASLSAASVSPASTTNSDNRAHFILRTAV